MTQQRGISGALLHAVISLWKVLKLKQQRLRLQQVTATFPGDNVKSRPAQLWKSCQASAALGE